MNFKEIIKKNSVLISNFSYLSFLQIATLLIPLVTYPYLIRIFEKELYGLIVLTQVVAGYFLIFISFGFNITGAKDISINRNNKEKLSEIFSSITIIKFLLFLISSILLAGYLLYFDVDNKLLYFLALWVCLNDIFLPTWYFQGIEKMKFITIITLINKVLFMLLIFIIIRTKDDAMFLHIINLIGTIISGILSFTIIKKQGVSFYIPSIKILKEQIKNAYHIFVSNVFTQIYVNSNKAIIGVFLGTGTLAYYDLAEKIVSLFRTPQNIISQTVFPKISAEKNVFFIRKTLLFTSVMNIVLYTILCIGAKYFVIFLGGKDMIETVNVIYILGLYVPIVGISNVLGVLTLISMGYNHLFLRMTFSSAIVYLILFVGAYIFNLINIYSMTIINILVEIFVTFLAFYYVYSNNILWKRT